jgi:type VI secretion system ImpB/VipA family protein
LQHKLDRVRRPRVQITYDVETNGSPIKKELPFVLGMMADLSGHPGPAVNEDGCDLQLMSAVKDVNGLPASGTDLVVVANVGQVLHFRVFAGDGSIIVDADERKFAGERRKLDDLKTRLSNLWALDEIPAGEKGQIIFLVTSIVGIALATPLAKRDFVEINRDNFGKVMQGIVPRLELSVPNQIQKDGTKVRMELRFRSLDDFEPENVVRQVGPLKQLLEAREKLADLKTKVASNDSLDAVLQKVIQHTEDLKKKTGGAPAAASGSQGTSA